MAADGLDHDDPAKAVLGGRPSWDRPTLKPLPLHPGTTEPTRFQVRVELVGSTPPIWRGLDLAADVTVDVLHDILQVAFGWTDSHLHRFAPAQDPLGREFEGILMPFDIADGDAGVPETDLRLDQLLAVPGDTLLYTYDFGDDWDHLITLETVEPRADAATAVCVAGGRHGAAEDVGGVHGWEHLLELAAKRNFAPQSEQWRHLWQLGLLHDFADEVDLGAVNRGLVRLDGAAAALDWLRAQPIGVRGPSPLAALVAAQTPAAQQVLGGYLSAAQLTQPIDLSEAANVTVVIRALLNQVGAGIKLTSAGYLPPAVVVALMSVLDPDKLWFGKANREDSINPLLHLRELTTTLGLTRKSKGHLLLTARGLALKERPEELLQVVALRAPVERSGIGSEVALLLLMLVAAGESSTWADLTRTLDLLTATIGWEMEDGGSYLNSSAIREARDTRVLLQWAVSGVLIERGLTGGIDGPGARTLARAALTTWG